MEALMYSRFALLTDPTVFGDGDDDLATRGKIGAEDEHRMAIQKKKMRSLLRLVGVCWYSNLEQEGKETLLPFCVQDASNGYMTERIQFYSF